MTSHSKTPTQQDLDTISLQLNRPARDVVEIGARCVCGNPLVATTAPRLSNGIPFPTTFYLTHPVLTQAISRLEAGGMMAEMSARLEEDEDLAAHYRRAHEAYLEERARIGEVSGVGEVPEIAGITAGGMPDRVKCLHVLAGHSLAAGPGVNPLGDEALEAISEYWTKDECWCEGAWDTEAAVPSKDLSRHVKRLQREGKLDAEGNLIEQPRYAALDCGTNSLRLLIGEPNPQGVEPAAGQPFVELHRDMEIVRLGEGVDKTGQFSPAALERTFAATEKFAAKIKEFGVPVSNVRFVATSASRDVSNRDEFMSGIQDRLGVAPEVITGDEEAALSFTGATGGLGLVPGTKVLVVDLGGGSTEFVTGIVGATPSQTRIAAGVSTDMGCVRFTERLLPSDPPTAEEIAAATAAIQEHLAKAAETVDFTSVEAIVGVAGTITTITAEALNLSEYLPAQIHGAECSINELKAASTELLEATRENRARRGFMHPGRVDVIGAGALIYRTTLEYVQERTNVLTAYASETDILDGTLLSQGL